MVLFMYFIILLFILLDIIYVFGYKIEILLMLNMCVYINLKRFCIIDVDVC